MKGKVIDPRRGGCALITVFTAYDIRGRAFVTVFTAHRRGGVGRVPVFTIH